MYQRVVLDDAHRGGEVVKDWMNEARLMSRSCSQQHVGIRLVELEGEFARDAYGCPSKSAAGNKRQYSVAFMCH
jgi:hypothetical protein